MTRSTRRRGRAKRWRASRRLAPRSTSAPSSIVCAVSSPRRRTRTARASEHGRSPQPGLSQLRLAQHRVDAALAAIRNVVDVPLEGVSRPRVLAAYVEILLAANDRTAAREIASELSQCGVHVRRAVGTRRGRARRRCGAARRWRPAWRAGRVAAGVGRVAGARRAVRRGPHPRAARRGVPPDG